MSNIPFAISQINIKEIQQNLFSEVAQGAAEYIQDKKDSGTTKEKNKTTQLRRFYDELVMWHDKVCLGSKEERAAKYANCAPFIQMLNAKIAYAKGRNLVNSEFVDVMTQLIPNIHDAQSLRNAKLFFEALMGFKKALELNK